MSLVQEFIDLIRTHKPSLFRIVGGAAEFAALTATANALPVALPACYFLIEDEQSSNNERAAGGPVLQLCEADVAAVIVCGNPADVSGAAAGADLENLKNAVRDVLIGYCPQSSEGIPVLHLQAGIIKFKNNVIWHRELFLASHYLEGKQT